MLQQEYNDHEAYQHIENTRHSNTKHQYGGSGMPLLEGGIVAQQPGQCKTHVTDKGHP